MQSQYFPSEKSGRIHAVYFGTIAVCLVWVGFSLYLYLQVKPEMFFVAIIGFLIWSWNSTSYTIGTDQLQYRSGPFRGSISIRSINQITKNDSGHTMLKPALAEKGLVIRHNGWKEIYISPVKKDQFVDLLLERNPAISVKDLTEINFNKY